MKVLILVSCVLAAASAVYVPYSVYPQHIPVIDSNGVPVEPLENQQARAAHYAALAEANARTGHYSPIAVPAVAAVAAVPAISHLPADTPEVAAARVQHFQDYAIAAQRNGVNVAIPAVAYSQYPVDTPEVQLAKAAHFAAHAAARANLHQRKRRDVYAIPAIGPDGVPVNTPEVQQATQAHLAAHAAITGVPLDTPEVAAAKARHLAAHAAAGSNFVVAPVAAPYAYSPVIYGSVYPHAAIGADGQPVETPEVQLAKAAHFAAHAAARHY